MISELHNFNFSLCGKQYQKFFCACLKFNLYFAMTNCKTKKTKQAWHIGHLSSLSKKDVYGDCSNNFFVYIGCWQQFKLIPGLWPLAADQIWQSMAFNFDAECESKSEFFDEKCIPFTNNECTLGPQIGLQWRREIK